MTHADLAEFPIIVRIPVQWGDMDAYGHVNNTVYFRFFESARIAYLEKCGFVDADDHEGVGAILHSTSCRFRKPLSYPDEVAVGGRAIDVHEDRFTMAYRIVSQTRDVVAAEGEGIIVAYDYRQGSKAQLPEIVRARIEQLDGVRRS